MHDSTNSLEAIARKNYSVDIGRFLSRGWEIFTNNKIGFISFLVLSSVIGGVLSFIISLLFLEIPLIRDFSISSIADQIFWSLIAAGNYFVAFKISRGRLLEFIDFFKGFQNQLFLPIFLASLVIGLLTIILSLPFTISFSAIIYNFLLKFIFTNILNADLATVSEIPISTSFIGPVMIMGLILLIPTIYLQISYMFTIPLIVDCKADFWPAMETSRRLITRQWFFFFCFSLVLDLINLAGFFACGVGLLFTLPWTVCAIAAAYENIVGLSPES
jgi:hypothetical protein